MATNKKRLSVTLDDEMWEMVENYRHERRISTMSKAFNELLQHGAEVVLNGARNGKTEQRDTVPSVDVDGGSRRGV